MKTDIIRTLTDTFEAHAQQTESGIEFWLARDLQHLLGYSKWENFLNVVSKAKQPAKSLDIMCPTIFPTLGKWSISARVARARQ